MKIDETLLKTMLSEHQSLHSPLQIANFIIQENSSGTIYGGYKQALRELQARHSTLKLKLLDLEDLDIDIEELEAREPLDRRQQVQLKRLQFRREGMYRQVAEIWREFSLFYHHARYLRAGLPPELDEETRYCLDLKTWTNEVLIRAELERACGSMPSMETLRMARAMPNSAELVGTILSGDDRATPTKLVLSNPVVEILPAPSSEELNLLLEHAEP